MTLDEFASRLEKAKPKKVHGNTGYAACCPAHEDETPSFAVWEGLNGWLHFNCQRGCTEAQVLQSLGLVNADLQWQKNSTVATKGSNGNGSKPKKVLVCSYAYRDLDGTVLFYKDRFDSGGKKDFIQRLPDNTYNLSSLGHKAKILYNFPELKAAMREGKTVYLNEGEKGADACVGKGLAATCQPGGAVIDRPESKWLPAHTKALRGANIVIIVDNDGANGGKPVGEVFASYVYHELLEVAASVRCVKSKTGDQKDDAYDHFNAGFAVDDFVPWEPYPKFYKYVEPVIQTVEMSLIESVEAGPSGKFYARTDLGNARRMVDYRGDDFRYVVPWKKWLVWDGRRFRIDDMNEVPRIAQDVALSIKKEAFDIQDEEERDAALKFANSCQDSKKLNSMMSLAGTQKEICVAIDDLDAGIWLLNCGNGTLNLQTGALTAFDRSNLLTKAIDTNYDPSAKCPQWIDFLDQVLAFDDEMVAFIQKAVGYTLTGSTKEQVLFFLHGIGRNGKSTFIGIIRSLLGEYGRTTRPDTLMKKKDEGVANDIARLKGARIVTSPEIEKDRKLNESKIKDLTGDDMISARFLFSEDFEFAPTFKIWMYGNHEPGIDGTDDGIWRRWLPIPFTVQISEDKIDYDLRDKLLDELPGILAWAVEGCLRWQKEGLGRPKSVTDAASEYRESVDVIGAFLKECTERTPSINVPARRLWQAYREWAKLTGNKDMAENSFGREMTYRKIEKLKLRDGIFYLDMSVKSKDENIYRGGE